MLLNPNLDNFRFEFNHKFYPVELTKKYDTFLYKKNGNIKTIAGLIHESCLNIDIPGFTIPESTLSGVNNSGPKGTNDSSSSNTTSYDYVLNVPWSEVINTRTVTLSLKNNLWNFGYFLEHFTSMFYRNKHKYMTEFDFFAILKDASNNDVLRYEFRNCIIKSIPEITFSHGETLSTSPQISLGLRFNNLDIVYLIPDFNTRIKIL